MAPRWTPEDQKKCPLAIAVFGDEGGARGSLTPENPVCSISDRESEQGAKESHLFPRHPLINAQDDACSSLLILETGKDS